MVFNLVIKPIVLSDIEEAVDFYDKRVGGLGKRIYNQFLSSLAIIQSKPFTFSYVKDPVRRFKIENFPYKIFYTLSQIQSSY